MPRGHTSRSEGVLPQQSVRPITVNRHAQCAPVMETPAKLLVAIKLQTSCSAASGQRMKRSTTATWSVYIRPTLAPC